MRIYGRIYESLNLAELYLTIYKAMVKVLSKLGINVTVKLAYKNRKPQKKKRSISMTENCLKIYEG